MHWKELFLRFIRMLLEVISRVIFYFIYYGDPHMKLPPIRNSIILESGLSLAAKIRNRQLTSEEVLEAFIARIKEINPILNCVVDERYGEALAEARNIDKYVRSEEFDKLLAERTKPFLGVPFTIKDCFKVKGLKQTSGLWSRKDFVADSDAPVVSIMRENGAIPLCVTNVSELCMWWETANTIYGRTNNPYRTCRIVGGSSGGEACLQAACGSPLGIGSDIGGSIRMPCFFSGIFGHKPSGGIVNNDGQEPVAVKEAQYFLTTGPMCRYISDVISMYSLLAADNIKLLKLQTKIDISNLKFYYIEDANIVPVTPVQSELRSAIHKVALHFEKTFGVTAKQVEIKQFKYSVQIYMSKLGGVEEAHTFAEELALKKGKINVWLELLKLVFRQSKHTFAGLQLALFETINKKKRNAYPKLSRLFKELEKEVKDMLGDDGILLFPSHPTTAPYHGQTLWRTFNFAYTAILNVLGLPATQCPLGLGSDGLPLGLQVVANHYQDHLTLAVATEIEKAFGGWVCPSEVL